ncbi:PREDICTED: kynurenine formamidase [Rhagoletis zephyria]|uniref:kynurenine formamidase n=1 Tax=Rhagoletis zephyria TaxID=28612 RepID=UPI0008119F73|nr:PREDICTED: kynurenine formamidase [Rhagoletis zephyria]
MYANSTGRYADLDKEYSPTKNSKRFLNTAQPDIVVIEQFLKTTTEQTQNARKKYIVRESVTYRKNNFNASTVDNQVVDIYYKDKEHGSPIFVYIHGGYWQELDRHTSGSFVEPLVEQGYRVIAADYNLCPTVTLHGINEQINDFYEWLFRYANDTQASKISISGHSAGAYLSTLLFNKRIENWPGTERIDSFFLISGIFDLRECWSLPSVNPMNILNLDETSSKALSPICWELDLEFIEFAKRVNLQVYVIAAENDSDTFKGQSLAYAKKLEKHGLQIELKIFHSQTCVKTI